MLDDQLKACAFIPVMHLSHPSPSPPCFLELSWAVLPCTNMQAYERLIRPALEGVENVLTTALSISSLEKVVLTSSVAAVAGSKTKLPADYVYSEADWNFVATDTYLPYNRSALRRHQGCSLNTIQDKFWKRQGRFRSFCIVQKSRSPAFWGPKGFSVGTPQSAMHMLSSLDAKGVFRLLRWIWYLLIGQQSPLCWLQKQDFGRAARIWDICASRLQMDTSDYLPCYSTGASCRWIRLYDLFRMP